MQKKFRSVNHTDGFVWLAIELHPGCVMMLYPMGRIGDCIRPGQRMIDAPR